MANPTDQPRPEKTESSRPTKMPRDRPLTVGSFIHSDVLEFSIASREHPDVRDARLRREQVDADHERRKELVILWAVLITVGVVSVVCIIMIALSGAPVDNAKWATTVLTTIVSAGVGYMTGKSSKSAK
jgi:hypothetical protein